jgi:hypothetical protein
MAINAIQVIQRKRRMAANIFFESKRDVNVLDEIRPEL